MKKQLVLLVLGLVAVLVLTGRLARAAVPVPAVPNDSSAWWSWDARQIAFQRERRGLDDVLVVPAGHGGARWIAPGFARGWRPGGGGLLVDTDTGTGTGIFAADGTPIGDVNGRLATWSPDGGRIAYIRSDVLYLSNPVGGAEHAVLAGALLPSWEIVGPVWSPDGSRIALATTAGLVVAQADGSGSHVVFSGANQSVNPSWSADGTTIAFERNDGPHWVVWLVGADGSDARPVTGSSYDSRFPQWAPVGDRLAFISDRQHVPGGATPFQYALYVQPSSGGSPTKLLDDVHPVSPPRWSPTAAQLAVAAGLECRRWGIYVVASEGKRSRRASNVCRFDGTAGPDTISGSPYFDIINGLGGNDVLRGNLGNDKISGESGDDTILAGGGNDFVLAGPGDDRVDGGPGNDVIIGGNGHDRIDCGPGTDTVEGAGPLDRIARNCEHVRR